MKNFIKADLYRVFTKPLRYIMLCIFGIMMIGVLIYQNVSGYSDVSMTNLMVGDNPIYGVLVMLVYIFTIFGDDFRAKNLQAAIGMGAFITQSATVASLVYILMNLNVAGFIMPYLMAFTLVGNLKIPTHYSTQAVQNFVNRLWLGFFDMGSFLVIVAYLAVGLGTAILVFKKRELEF